MTPREVIRERREAYGLTQRDAAARALVARQTWARAEAGAPVQAMTLRRIAGSLNIPMSAFGA